MHVTDSEPGIRRLKAGRGFYFRDADGAKLTDKAILERIRKLAIPPAWTDVWICVDPAGHIQATGRDGRERKQYRYHPAWTAMRDAQKFSNLTEFADRLPTLRCAVEKDMLQPALSRERVLATVLRLLDRTLIRVGNDAYATENQSYGLTTLRSRHLALEGTRLRFSFKGKSGREWSLQVADRRIANTVRQLQDLPGQRLFRYRDDTGSLHDVHSHDVNDYMCAMMDKHFTSKHFRTWGATVLAAVALEKTELPSTKRAQAELLNGTVDAVAQNLRHTRAVCRSCYIHPSVITEWEEGRIGRQMGSIRQRLTDPTEGLELDEEVVLRWLKRRERAGTANAA